MKLCCSANCMRPALSNQSYCEEHSKMRTRTYRYTNDSRVRSKEWDMFSKLFLKQYPTCKFCGNEAKVVDHIIPFHIVGDIDDIENYQSLCQSCHAKKTGIELKYFG